MKLTVLAAGPALSMSLGLSLVMFSASAFAGDISMGKEKSVTCAGCHGANGIGLSEEFPNLAGQKEAYLVKQLNAFKTGGRQEPTMKTMAASLTESDIQNLAAYYASLSPAASSQSAVAPDMSLGMPTAKATKAEFPETVFITMKKAGTVEAFPSETVWQGGPNMLYNAITPDGKTLLATSPSTSSVYVFDAKTGAQRAVIKVGKAPKGVKIMPNGKFAYVSNEGSAEISVVDLKALKVVDTIKVAEAPHNVRFTKNGKLAYVTLQGGAGIGVIDTHSRKMIKVIPVPGITGPHNMDLSLDEKTAYVRDFVHHVAVLDLKTGAVKKVITVGNGHGGIDVAPNGKYVATAAIGDNFISVIDTHDLSVKNIMVGNGPHGIRASKDSRWIYVTLTKDNAVAVINARTLTVEKKIAVGAFPFWVAVQGNS